jgi:hypothetical protein
MEEEGGAHFAPFGTMRCDHVLLESKKIMYAQKETNRSEYKCL